MKCLQHALDLDQKIHSSAYDIVAKPILEKLNAFRILRLKINCYPNSGKALMSGWHIDLPNKHKVAPTPGKYQYRSCFRKTNQKFNTKIL